MAAAFEKKHYVRFIVGLVLLYLVFLLDLGAGTLAQQLYRIGTTPEAQRLGSDLADTFLGFARTLIDRARELVN